MGNLSRPFQLNELQLMLQRRNTLASVKTRKTFFFFNEKWLHVTIQLNSKAMQRDSRDQMKYTDALRGHLSQVCEGG